MGNIKRIIKKTKVSKPLLNNRFTVELCENVHIHYRNLRLEFPKEEFLLILQLLKGVNEDEVRNFNYEASNFKGIVHSMKLPNDTEYDNRFQYEEQVNGQYHVHYKNLRLEFKRDMDGIF